MKKFLLPLFVTLLLVPSLLSGQTIGQTMHYIVGQPAPQCTNPGDYAVQIDATPQSVWVCNAQFRWALLSGAVTGTSAPTNFGANLSTQTIIAPQFQNGNASIYFYVLQTTAGVGCSSVNNQVSVTASYTDPNGSTQQVGNVPGTTTSQLTGLTLGILGNGSVSAGSGTFSAAHVFVAVNGSSPNVTFSASSTLSSTGCTTTPQYVIRYVVN